METRKWPVLTSGETPRIDLQAWRFRFLRRVDRERCLTWEEFMALPKVERISDIHWMTRWSRLRERERPGFWERNGYHRHGDPWTERRHRAG